MQKGPPVVPIEYAGKWIAWDHDMTRIVASGSSPTEVVEGAKKAGVSDPILDKSPRANVRLIGGPRRFDRAAAQPRDGAR